MKFDYTERYSVIRKTLFDMLAEEKIPTTLLFCGKSAFCSDVKNSIFNVTIPLIDFKVSKPENELTKYDKDEMKRGKKRLIDMLNAMDDEKNCNYHYSDWVKDKF